MREKLTSIINDLKDKGIPLLFVKDPISKLPSVSLTMLVVSFTLTVLSLLNKVAKIFEGVDIDNTLELLIITSSLYFGRALTRGNTSTNIEKKGE